MDTNEGTTTAPEAATAAPAKAARKPRPAKAKTAPKAPKKAAPKAKKAKGVIKGNIIPAEYRKDYGKAQNNGDKTAKAFKDATTGKDGKFDPTKLSGIARANKVDLGRWSTLNVGMQRMNLGNVLRGMHNRGEQVTIASIVFKGTKEGAGGKL